MRTQLEEINLRNKELLTENIQFSSATFPSATKMAPPSLAAQLSLKAVKLNEIVAPNVT